MIIIFILLVISISVIFSGEHYRFQPAETLPGAELSNDISSSPKQTDQVI